MLICRPGWRLGEGGDGLGHDRPDGGREPGQANPSGGQPDVGGELGAGGIDASDDLGGSGGEQVPGLGEADAAPDPLQQLGAGLGLEPGEVMGDGRLRVVQLCAAAVTDPRRATASITRSWRTFSIHQAYLWVTPGTGIGHINRSRRTIDV